MNAVVADAGPLIAFAVIGRLGLLHHLYQEIIIPGAVHKELRTDADMPGSKALKQALDEGWLQLSDHPPPIESMRQLSQILDTGEAEALLLTEWLATHENYRFLLIDERKGRRAALVRDLKVAGTGAVLFAAKHNGLISSVEAELIKLGYAGYRLSDALQKRLLVLADE